MEQAECILEDVRRFIVCGGMVGWVYTIVRTTSAGRQKVRTWFFIYFFQNKCKHSVEDNSCNIQNISAIVGNVKYLKKISMIKENVKNNNKQFLHSTTQDCAASYLQLYTGTNVQISSEVFSTSTEEWMLITHPKRKLIIFSRSNFHEDSRTAVLGNWVLLFHT